MKKSKKPAQFIQTPSYEGTKEELFNFLIKNLNYPKKAVENGIEGTVIINCDINQDGRVTKTTIKKSLGYGCDEEAIRLVKMIRFQKTNQKGVHVVYHKTLKIPFKLPSSAKKKTAAISYKYNIAQENHTNTSNLRYTITYQKKLSS